MINPTGFSKDADLVRWLSMARAYVETLPPKTTASRAHAYETTTARNAEPQGVYGGSQKNSQETRSEMMRGHILSILGYIVATFVTQATSHFVIFAQHYAAVAYIKTEPVFVLGFASMIIQGTILSFVFTSSRGADPSRGHTDPASNHLMGRFLYGARRLGARAPAMSGRLPLRRLRHAG